MLFITMCPSPQCSLHHPVPITSLCPLPQCSLHHHVPFIILCPSSQCAPHRVVWAYTQPCSMHSGQYRWRLQGPERGHSRAHTAVQQTCAGPSVYTGPQTACNFNSRGSEPSPRFSEHLHTHANTQARRHTHINTQAHMHTYTQICTNIYTCTHPTHAHTCVQSKKKESRGCRHGVINQ